MQRETPQTDRIDGSIHRHTPPEGAAELQLWAAVLHLGLLDAIGGTGTPPLEADRALRWLYSTKNHPGSFVWICVLLDLDPTAVKAAWLKQIKARQQ